jgi:hypothetical protein
MECRDVSVVGIAPAGKLGLAVEAYELGGDAMRKLKPCISGILVARLTR